MSDNDNDSQASELLKEENTLILIIKTFTNNYKVERYQLLSKTQKILRILKLRRQCK